MNISQKDLVVATNNAGKLREFQRLLAAFPVHLQSLRDVNITVDVAETGRSFAENASLKATTYARMVGKWTLADDSGLTIDALGGRPGLHSARYAGGHDVSFPDKWAALLKELSHVSWDMRTAQFRCAVALATPHGEIAAKAEGICPGVIAFEPAGTGGFGYDPLFFLPEHGCTMAQLANAEKDHVSHRGRALRALGPALEEIMRSGWITPR